MFYCVKVALGHVHKDYRTELTVPTIGIQTPRFKNTLRILIQLLDARVAVPLLIHLQSLATLLKVESCAIEETQVEGIVVVGREALFE
jgi:hypothetical protein